MKKENLSEKILEALQERYPQRNRLVNKLADLLMLEKEAVYRRLRGYVPFTLEEAATISKELKISLDTLIGTYYRLNPYTSDLPLKEELREANYKKLVDYVDKIKEISLQPHSEHAQVLGTLTLAICLPYPHLLRFLIFRYQHLYEDNKNAVERYEECKISIRVQEQFQRMNYYLSSMRVTHSIWDPNLIRNMVESVRYFLDTQLIRLEDKTKIKEELFQFLDDYEEYATQGMFTKTGHKFYLYISGIQISFSHAYLLSEKHCMSIFITFVLQTITMMDEQICLKMKSCVRSIENMSTMISIVSEKERASFFRNQREIVASL